LEKTNFFGDLKENNHEFTNYLLFGVWRLALTQGL
jgi:hypothetical protein